MIWDAYCIPSKPETSWPSPLDVSSYSTFDYHVIHIHLDVPPYISLKYFIHYPLECHPWIFFTPNHDTLYQYRHQPIIKDVPILKHHPYLVISRKHIPEGEEPMAWGSINQLIDARERVAMFQTYFIEIGVINIHSQILIIFFNQYNNSKLLGVLHFDFHIDTYVSTSLFCLFFFNNWFGLNGYLVWSKLTYGLDPIILIGIYLF